MCMFCCLLCTILVSIFFSRFKFYSRHVTKTCWYNTHSLSLCPSLTLSDEIFKLVQKIDLSHRKSHPRNFNAHQNYECNFIFFAFLFICLNMQNSFTFQIFVEWFLKWIIFWRCRRNDGITVSWFVPLSGTVQQ